MKELIRDMVSRMKQELDKVTWFEIRSELSETERAGLMVVYQGLAALSVKDPAEWERFNNDISDYMAKLIDPESEAEDERVRQALEARDRVASRANDQYYGGVS
jgi:hypothetical protein